MRLLLVSQDDGGAWSRQIASFVKAAAPVEWEVTVRRVGGHLPPLIDDAKEFLPRDLPAADLLLVLSEGQGLAQLTPELAAMAGAGAVIVPVDSEEWLPRGLKNQLRRQLAEAGIGAVFPSPFCSLSAAGSPDEHIAEFARHFGKPEFIFACDDDGSLEITVVRSCPCGNSRYVAEKLQGTDIREAETQGPLLHHYYPCLASVSLIHKSALITRAAIQEAVCAATTEPLGRDERECQ